MGNNAASWVDGSTGIDTNWHHAIIVVRNSGNDEVWLDGSSSKEIDQNIGAAQPQGIRIGGCMNTSISGPGGTPSQPFSGKIAEVAVWTALDMTGSGSGDEYEEVNDYICDKYGSTMTGCP